MGQINRIANKMVRILAGVSPIYGFARRFSSSGCDCLPSAREAREILDVASSRPARCVLPLTRDWPDVHEVEDTVVVPCFNASKHVVERIESVLGQRTSRSFEVIAIEDGSTDDTGNLLDGIAARDGRLRVAHQANRGFSGARNKGISLARGGFFSLIPMTSSNMMPSRPLWPHTMRVVAITYR